MILKKIIRKIKSDIKKNFYYIIYLLNRNDYRIKVNLLSIEETIDFMSKEGNSIIRYGDGEFSLIKGIGIGDYQFYNETIALGLRKILSIENSRLMICLPEPILGVEKYKKSSKKHWILTNKESQNIYRNLIEENRIYGNSFVSRPYMIYEDKTKSNKWFESIINVFKNKNLIIIEGIYSRTGVGNDLFGNANSVKRILCPPTNAIDYYEEIYKESLKLDKNSLILIALGPTGKLLAWDLFEKGYWVLDIGHIDSEYEWFKRNATKKEKIENKHSAEQRDEKFSDFVDADYENSIISKIGC